ncbi:hypothetical protein EK21DRAFT_82365 [Setomelanomma holmii]|uniref:Uncharacterized protein n=1 Tax=Setomelanomma holmii TaxID=210430 RepID=A0A9P4GU77_9PLEO|nr:hypothetical protein EK21DRAFT_82365 [Setomelanomma holmii]
MDPIQQQIFNFLNPHRRNLPESLVRAIAGNITFLIKYTAGPALKPENFTVTVIDVRGLRNEDVGHKATVCFHDGPGKFAVVICKQVKWGENVLMGLMEKVDKAVKEILAKERNDGCGDF